ncbi:TolC family protein [Halothiobacillus sp. DCM-1]|uniref:TolC family protein n=1 Tax=Halothiobacillus sp. DCM-1 TaxID=3112558 RepID=UPI0032447E1E
MQFLIGMSPLLRGRACRDRRVGGVFTLLVFIPLVWAKLGLAQPVVADLSLAEVKQRALQVDEGVRAAVDRHQAAAIAAPAAGELPDPVLAVGLQNVPLDNFSMTRLPTTMAGVTLTQMFPAGDTLAERQRGAEAAARVADATAHLTRRALVRTVSDEWLSVFAAERALHLLDEQQALLDRWEGSAQTGYSAGRVSASDLVDLRVRLAKLSDQRQQLLGQAEAARARLARWLGARAQAPWPTTLPTELMQTPHGAVEDQPSLRVLRDQVQVARSAVGEARAALSPEIGVSLGYGINAGTMPNTASVGISISLPLFAGDRQLPKLRAAQRQLGAAQLALDEQAAQLTAQQQALQASVQSASARLDNYDKRILPALQRIATLAQNQFAAGNGDFAAVIKAQEALIDAQQARLDVLVDRARQLIDLNYLLEAA